MLRLGLGIFLEKLTSVLMHWPNLNLPFLLLFFFFFNCPSVVVENLLPLDIGQLCVIDLLPFLRYIHDLSPKKKKNLSNVIVIQNALIQGPRPYLAAH